MIENSSLYIKIFPMKFYFHLDAFEPIVQLLLPLWLTYSLCAENVDLSIFLEITRNHWQFRTILWMTYQIDVLVAQNVVIDVGRVISIRWLLFLISWKATGKLMVLYHSELNVLRCSSSTIATCPGFPKIKRPFACKSFVRKHVLLD